MDIAFLPPLPTIFFLPSTHTLFVHLLFMIWIEISHLLLLNKIQTRTHTKALISTSTSTRNFVRVLEHKNHRPDSKFTCCSTIVSFVDVPSWAGYIIKRATLCSKISLHNMRGFCIACWLVGSPLNWMEWFSCYLVSSDKHVHWTCGTWLHADLFVECERRWIFAVV